MDNNRELRCDCGGDFVVINDESQKILWCQNCGSIKIKYFTEKDFKPVLVPHKGYLAGYMDGLARCIYL